MERGCVFLFVTLFLFFSLTSSRPVLLREGDVPLPQQKREAKHELRQQEGEENDDVPNSEVDGGYYFNDPSYHLQWHLQNLGAVPGDDLMDLAVVPAWEEGYTGKGVAVAVVDSKLDQSLPDLKQNIDGSLCKDFNFGATTSLYPDHAAAVAGLIGAVGGNKYCGAGVAFQSTISSIRVLDSSMSDEKEAAALSWNSNKIDIYSCNWGPSDDGDTLQGPRPKTAESIEQTATKGRNGKGGIYVWAAGNGNENNDNCNYDGYANSPYTIAVGAMNSYGKYSSFSEPCAAMLTTAPGGEEVGDTIVGITTTDAQDCSTDFAGTDYSAPQVAGVVALMLEANPALTWRDVQTIIVQSSRVMSNGEEKGVDGWVKNGAGLMHHDHFGFGLLNASKAVFLAKEWNKNALRTRSCLTSKTITVKEDIPDNETLTSHYKFPDVTFSVEHVRVIFSSTHPYWGDIAVNLTSPSGTVSQLSTRHGEHKDSHQKPAQQYDQWPFMTVKNWGENPSGGWYLSVIDARSDEYSGTFDDWELEVCGYYTTSSPSPTPPPVYKPDNTPAIDIEYEDNRSVIAQIGAIFWRFLVILLLVFVVTTLIYCFAPVDSLLSSCSLSSLPCFSLFQGGRGQRDEEGIFDSGDDL